MDCGSLFPESFQVIVQCMCTPDIIDVKKMMGHGFLSAVFSTVNHFEQTF